MAKVKKTRADIYRSPVPLYLAVSILILAFVSCGKGEDLSYTNPQWRASVKDEVSFPLENPTTLTVGLARGMSAVSNSATEWIAERTNINLEFTEIPSSPGDVLLGEWMREGELTDLTPEYRMPLNKYTRDLFVDFLEFPSLVPNFKRLVKEDVEFRNGILANLTFDGKLFSLGSYDPDIIPYAGVIAFRQDLFEKHRLSAGTWDELRDSLERLKQLFPDSYPFGGQFRHLLYAGPSWFGSGLDTKNLVYFDPEEKEWRFGPFEPEFEPFVKYFADLYARSLLSPDIFVGRQDETRTQLLTQKVFVAPFAEFTGPFFSYGFEGFGGIDDDGNWNGEGMWISSLPIPGRGPIAVEDGRPARSTADFSTRVRSGWLVHSQSKHVSEAIALLDFLYSEETAFMMAFGPEGVAWEFKDGKMTVNDEFLGAYRSGGKEAISEKLNEKGIELAMPLGGLSWSFYQTLGYPQNPGFRYYISHDIANCRFGVEIPKQPGLIISSESGFSGEKAMPAMDLKTHIESQIARFISGERALDEYDEFIEELKEKGVESLLKLYKDNSRIGDLSDLFDI